MRKHTSLFKTYLIITRRCINKALESHKDMNHCVFKFKKRLVRMLKASILREREPSGNLL